MKTNVYQMVTDRIIAQMEKGIIPWRKPWHGFATKDPEMVAMSYETGHVYSTLNQWLLGEPGEYLTFKQIDKRGGTIRKGEKARMVVFTERLIKEDPEHLDDEGKPKIISIPFLKYYNVWNLNQVEGIEPRWKGKTPVAAEPKQEKNAEDIIGGYMSSDNHPKLTIKVSDKAFYRPATDEVVVPSIKQYDNVAEYYSTLFHELTHSTGHKSRCNRKGVTNIAAFGSESYSQEELVAEMGGAMLLSLSGIDNEAAFKNNVGYIQGWLRSLKNDPKMIVWASGLAEKAVKWILGIKDEKKEDA